jgi:hypothetical protein
MLPLQSIVIQKTISHHFLKFIIAPSSTIET